MGGKRVLIVVGAVLGVLGLVWLFQGLGVLGGSAMSGESTWTVIGLLVAALGAALISAGLVRGRRGQPPG